MLLNIAGAKPGEMDRSTQGNPAKYTFCFGENEEENPWTPYHVQRGFAPTDNVVTVMSGEGPHNLNDHGSTTGDGLLTTFAGSMSTPGANTVYGKGPMLVIIGPEHAATLKRDGFTIDEHPRGAVQALARARLAHLQGEPGDLHQHRPQAGRRLVHHRPLSRRHPHHRGRRSGQALGLHPVVRRHDRRRRADRRMSDPE